MTQQYRRLMEGLKVEQPKANRPVHELSMLAGAKMSAGS